MFNTLKVFAATLALGATMVASVAANANPISFYYSVNGGGYTQFGSTADGSNTASLTGAGYSIQASGLGSPFLKAPNFQSSSIDFLAGGPVTLSVMAVETGLTTPGITGFSLGFTNNAGSTISVSESFALLLTPGSITPTILATSTLTPNTATTSNVSYGSLPTNYGVAEIYTATFGPTGGAVNATISETGIPEPMTMSLLGAGLVGLGVVRLRRKSLGA